MNSDEIFQKYIDDRCPECDCYIDADSPYGHTEAGGKCMAKYFVCRHCGAEYTIGFNRRYIPIDSEITLNGSKK